MTKSNRGGLRPGAGRKSALEKYGEPITRISTTVYLSDLKFLKMRKHGRTVRDAIRRLITLKIITEDKENETLQSHETTEQNTE
jgi:hypothetical protein